MSERYLAVLLECRTRQFRSTERAVSKYGEASTAETNAVMCLETNNSVTKSVRKQAVQ
jgi:hypothetical protein